MHMNINNHRTILLEHPLIYLDATGATTTALLISDGRIVATGQEAIRQASATSGDNVEHQQPRGACIFPALTDAHAHPWGLSQRANTLRLDAQTSTDAIYDALQNAPESSINTRGWLVGMGWDQHQWQDQKTLSLAKLDALYPNIPLLLYRTDHHAIYCNSEAMRRAGITPINQTGLLVDEEMFPVTRALGESTLEDNLSILAMHTNRMKAFGVTCIHQAYMSVRDVQMLRNHPPNIRIYGMVNGKDEHLDELLELGPQHDPKAHCSIRTVKFFADGALGSQGALLHQPYLHTQGHRGQAVTDAATLKARIKPLLEAGWQVAVHAIGDAAATAVIDAYATVDAPTRQRTRPRLEHAQMLTDEDVARMHDLNILPSIQPIHFYSDMPWVDQHLSAEQTRRLYRWRDLPEPIAAGSDFPIDDPNPWHGICTALTRRASDQQIYDSTHRLTRKSILLAYTRWAAYAAHWEDHLGHLHSGAVADYIVLPHCPFEADMDTLWNMMPLQTHCAIDRANEDRVKAQSR